MLDRGPQARGALRDQGPRPYFVPFDSCVFGLRKSFTALFRDPIRSVVSAEFRTLARAAYRVLGASRHSPPRYPTDRYPIPPPRRRRAFTTSLTIPPHTPAYLGCLSQTHSTPTPGPSTSSPVWPVAVDGPTAAASRTNELPHIPYHYLRGAHSPWPYSSSGDRSLP